MRLDYGKLHQSGHGFFAPGDDVGAGAHVFGRGATSPRLSGELTGMCFIIGADGRGAV